jgi:hypothetical protein
MLKLPGLKSATCPSSVRVPSGNIQILLPFKSDLVRFLSATAAWAGFFLSIGIQPTAFIKLPITGAFKSSFFETKPAV